MYKLIIVTTDVDLVKRTKEAVQGMPNSTRDQIKITEGLSSCFNQEYVCQTNSSHFIGFLSTEQKYTAIASENIFVAEIRFQITQAIISIKP